MSINRGLSMSAKDPRASSVLGPWSYTAERVLLDLEVNIGVALVDDIKDLGRCGESTGCLRLWERANVP
jgi:hypothetical protein